MVKRDEGAQRLPSQEKLTTNHKTQNTTMATSLTDLVLDIASKESILAARAHLAPLGRFAHSFALAENEKGNVVKIPVFSRAAAGDFSASNNYTSATSAGVSGKNITLDKHKWCSQRLLPDDAMETDCGRDWASQTTISTVESVAKALAQDALIAIVNGGTASAGLFGDGASYISKVATARTKAIAADIAPSRATLLVSSDFYSQLLAELPADVYGSRDALLDGYIDRILGFGRIAEIPDSTFVGAVVADDAFGVATRLPLVQNPELFEVSDIAVPELGPWSFRVRATGANSTDAKFLGAEIVYGVAVLQPAAILVNT